MQEDKYSTLWYFAYGSNMDSARLAKRIGRSIKGRRALLEGWSLAFDKVGSANGEGFANIHPAPNKCVWGVLYELTDKELAALDRFEGDGYKRQRVTVWTQDLGTVQADVYIGVRCGANLKPRAQYLEHLLQGAKEHEIPKDYIKLLAMTPLSDTLPLKRRDKSVPKKTA